MSVGAQCCEVCLLDCGILNVTAYRAHDKTSVRVLVLSQAESSHVNPLYYSFPVSVACSTGLLLPVASVPMALAHEALLGYEASKMVGRARAARRSLALGSFFSLKFYSARNVGSDGRFPRRLFPVACKQ